MLRFSSKKKCALALVVILAAAILTAGCSSQKPSAQAPRAVGVKAMQVIQQDTPITYEYAGQVQAKNEVKLLARVSGNITAKMVNGGDTVSKGQPLFQIDRRSYESAVLSGQAQLAQAEATLGNAQADTIRYRKLAAIDGVAKQTLDTQITTEQQNAAMVDYYRATVQKAADDLADTLIVSPVDGRIDVNDLSVGSYVAAGSTVLATVSSTDPVFVQFSMSENEYLKLASGANGALTNEWGKNLKLVLSNGSQYPLSGKIEQIDRGLAQNTGTLTIKAVFDNPQKVLIPGMFARVEATAEMRKGALLIPQRAVQQMLDKTYVTIVGEGDKAETRMVKMGAKIGNLWLVEEGLTSSDRVVVEGVSKLQPGTQLQVAMIGVNDLQTMSK